MGLTISSCSPRSEAKPVAVAFSGGGRVQGKATQQEVKQAVSGESERSESWNEIVG